MYTPSSFYGDSAIPCEIRNTYIFMYMCVYIHMHNYEHFFFLWEKYRLFEQEMVAAVTSYFNEINLYLQFAVIESFHHSAELPRCSLSTAAGPLVWVGLCASGPQHASHPDVVTYSHTSPVEMCQCGHMIVIN